MSTQAVPHQSPPAGEVHLHQKNATLKQAAEMDWLCLSQVLPWREHTSCS